MIQFLSWILQILSIIIPLLLAIAYFTLAERKILGSIQRRRGPNLVGILGVLQPLADGLKLLLKELIVPTKANVFLFILAPLLSLTLSFSSWAVIPFEKGSVYADINLGVLYIFAISSLSVYGIIISGWSSNSKYAFLGSLRAAAQMISYEVSIGLIIICILLCTGSLNLTDIVLAQEKVWFIIPMFPLFLIFFISGLAETNRPPFDLPEAEGELVAGYNVEYSSMGFAMFFLGEYGNMILMSSLISILFLGGWIAPFGIDSILPFPGYLWFMLKVLVMVYLFILTRATYPRYRYDQLMQLGWKVFLPLSIGFVLFVSGLLIGFDCLP